MQSNLSAILQANSQSSPFASTVNGYLPQVDKPNATPYIMALLEADGRVPLAAERMKVSVGEFVYHIASDPDAQGTIERALRIFNTIKLFELLGEANVVAKASLSSLEPFEASKTLTNISELIERSTRNNNHETNINIFDAAMRMVPPNVRDALTVLAQQQQSSPDMVIDHSDIDDD